MLAGEGLPIDAVVADFISGAAEMISPDNEEAHWDVIEGQGSLFHPGYSGVSSRLAAWFTTGCFCALSRCHPYSCFRLGALPPALNR